MEVEGGVRRGIKRTGGKKTLYNQSHSQLYLWLEEMSSGLSHP